MDEPARDGLRGQALLSARRRQLPAGGRPALAIYGDRDDPGLPTCPLLLLRVLKGVVAG